LAGRGKLVLPGTGDEALQKACQRLSPRHANFCFIRRFSLPLSDLLYENGDLFLMPSSFEPCGVSQMLAMKAGQPPLVHAVGGLADTVDDDEDGFSFSGDSIGAQATAFLQRLDDALTLRETNPSGGMPSSMRQRHAAFPGVKAQNATSQNATSKSCIHE